MNILEYLPTSFCSQNSAGAEAAQIAKRNILVGDQQILALPIGKYFAQDEEIQEHRWFIELSSNAMWRSIAPSL